MVPRPPRRDGEAWAEGAVWSSFLDVPGPVAIAARMGRFSERADGKNDVLQHEIHYEHFRRLVIFL